MNSFENTYYDIIIIGGGAVGSGIALDASLRGYSVLLLEKNDFSSGSSSKSTKLVHGGIRYLEKAFRSFDKSQYILVKEALKERSIFLNNASHLSSKLSLLTPIYKFFDIFYFYIGLFFYDLLALFKSFGRSSFVRFKDIKKDHNVLKTNCLYGGVRYYDGSFIDIRMNIALVKTANSLGCVVKNYHSVSEFLYKSDKLNGVKVQDIITLDEYSIYSKVIINATGIAVDTIRLLDDYSCSSLLEFSSGVHLVVGSQFFSTTEGILIPKTKDNRVIFILPWQGYCLIGTTDNKTFLYDDLIVSDDEVDYLLDHVNDYLDINICKSDILSSWKGIRPLIKVDDDISSSNIVREHIINKSKSNLISIAGGKWTTYRKMSEDVLDFIIDDGLLKYKKECQTKDYKIIGSDDISSIDKSIDDKLYSMLFSLYGSKAEDILYIAKNEDAYEKINNNFLYIKAMIIYSVRYEYVKKPLDFLLRRVPMLLLNKKESLSSLEYITSVISSCLKWNKKRYEQELYITRDIIQKGSF